MEKVEKIEWKNCKHLIQVFFTYLQEFFFGVAGFQNKFFFISQHLACYSKKKDKAIDCAISWKSKRVYISILSLQNTVF